MNAAGKRMGRRAGRAFARGVVVTVAVACAASGIAGCGGLQAPSRAERVVEPCVEAGENAALAHLNARRAAAGVEAWDCDAALGRAARAHARYLAANDGAAAAPHAEAAENPGFRGATAGERARAAGVDPALGWLGESVGGLAAEGDEA